MASKIQEFRNAGQMLYDQLRLQTQPVGIKYVRDSAEIPRSLYRPSYEGKKLSLCQAISLARKFKRQVGITSEDNFCVPASYAHGWVKLSFEEFIESQVRNQWRKDRQAEIAAQMTFSEDYITKDTVNKMRFHRGFMVAPLCEAPFVPDTVMIYGLPGQVLHIIQAISYEGLHMVTSSFYGFGESCIKGALKPYLTGQPQYVSPGSGDRTLSGTGENEVAIGMPAALLADVKRNLFKTGGPYNAGLQNWLLPHDGVDENLLPGWAYLKAQLLDRAGG